MKQVIIEEMTQSESNIDKETSHYREINIDKEIRYYRENKGNQRSYYKEINTYIEK